MATAASAEAWYAWCSPALFSRDIKDLSTLIPMCSEGDAVAGPDADVQLVVGFHVGYDRARVKEEYWFERTRTAFLDLMSMHVAIGGFTSVQQTRYRKSRRADADAAAAAAVNEGVAMARQIESTLDDDDDGLDTSSSSSSSSLLSGRSRRPSPVRPDEDQWQTFGTLNSLADITEHYLGRSLDKTAREAFSSESLDEIADAVPELLSYCALDVAATHECFRVVWPRFVVHCPHPVSFAGLIELGRTYLPITETWDDYIAAAESQYAAIANETEKLFLDLAEKTLGDEEHKATDVWLAALDWTRKPTPPALKKDGTPRKAVGNPLLRGKPAWYRDLWDSKKKRIHITPAKRAAGLMLKLKWGDFPIIYAEGRGGWSCLVPRDRPLDGLDDWLHSAVRSQAHLAPITLPPPRAAAAAADCDGAAADQDPFAGYYICPLPNNRQHGRQVGNPLSKTFASDIASGLMHSDIAETKELMRLRSMISYWTGSRRRIMNQWVVKPESVLEDPTANAARLMPSAVILPQVIAMGTVTRRAVEPTWMVASNAKKDRLGSELKCQVRAPPGYAFVGADVDSEELWIASLFSDSDFGMVGSTALSFMTLQGTKANKTDLHSMTGSLLSISRDEAKVFNYSRIYGAGYAHSQRLLQQCNPSLRPQDAAVLVRQLFQSTKGSKIDAVKLQRLRARGLLPEGCPATGFYYGGTESFLFNKLEAVAYDAVPATPVLHCSIPQTLLPENVRTQFLTSRANWVVQSSGVDYLHLLLVAMQWLMKAMGLRGRLCITIHDEVRFLVAEADTLRAVYAMQVANLWVRAMFSYRFGIEELPLNAAFFSAVDVDHVLRKEVDMPCVTPSNPVPIPPGRALDIYDTLRELEAWKQQHHEDPLTWQIPPQLPPAPSADEPSVERSAKSESSEAVTMAVKPPDELYAKLTYLQVQHSGLPDAAMNLANDGPRPSAWPTRKKHPGYIRC
ncbi:DNA/RNA polymerase [Caulochytrium protostelioides]|uniref:Mitochondrial DNA polymerase catalytic subunit n=1 Tax=Caulochytrium protostelioides TaxID=1555241 RepID=A0A4V1ITD2_9FUNG|nr:DNA/RNA polymerase [Caulochytrium protostelioides]